MYAIIPKKSSSSGAPRYLPNGRTVIFFSVPAFSSMMTNTNSTMMAPA